MFLRKLEIDLPEDPVNTTLGNIPPKCPWCHTGVCFTIFMVALFVITRRWKQLRCSKIKEWIQKMLFVYKMEYCSAIKNEDSLVFCRQMYGTQNIILRDITQTQSDMHGMYSLISGY